MLSRCAAFCLLLPLAGCFDPGTAEDTDEPATGSTSGSGGPEDGSSSSPSTSGGDSDPSGVDSDPSDDDSGPSGVDTDGTTGDPDGNTSGTTDSDPTTGSDGESSSGDASCDAGATCVADVPGGWQGPVLLYDDAGEPPVCPGAAPQVVHDLGAGLVADNATCTCECGDPTGLSCGPATLTARGDNCFSILFDPPNWQLADGSCVPIFAAHEAFNLSNPTLQGAGSCAEIIDEDVPPAAFDRNVRGCEAVAEAGECDGVCAPETDGDYDQICIYFEGDVACPGDVYTERTVAHEGIADDRGCSECTCGDPTGTCEGQAFLTDFDCGAGAVFLGNVNAGGCGVASGPPSHAQYSAEIDAECAPSGGDPEGEATPTDTVTFCCLP